MKKLEEMVSGNCMISLGQIIFLLRVFGFFIILVFILNPLAADDLIDKYKKLGDEYYLSNQFFLSYQNYSSAFILESNTNESLSLGIKAFESCLNAKRVKEGEWVLKSLSSIDEDPLYYNSLLALLYLKGDKLKKANEILSEMDNPNDNILLLKSYYSFLIDDYSNSRSQLNKVKLSNNDLIRLKNNMNNEVSFKEKNPILGVSLSLIIPGAGQVYSGHLFDGLNALAINGLLGATSGVLWYYEMDKSHNDRNYFLPSISSIIFSLFYITNLYNSYNSVNRYNNYQKSQYYGNILKKFNIVMNNNSLFIGYKGRI